MSGWGTWDSSWLWALALVPITVAVHVAGIAGIAIAARWNRGDESPAPVRHAFVSVVVTLASVGLALAVLHLLECGIWAVVYLKLGALPTPGAAMLYSVDSMTTRGESGLTVTAPWRMLGAGEALDGMLLFGISTAFIFAAMHGLWRRRLSSN